MAAREPDGPAAPALLLCAHGRGGTAEDHHVPETLADTLRAGGRFAEVEACYLRGSPGIGDALARLRAAEVVLVPLLMAEGHTSKVVLPDALAAVGEAAGRVRVTAPVGVASALTDLVVSVGLSICGDRHWSPAETTILVAAHGTARHADSGGSAQRLVDRITASGRFRQASAGFIEQEPKLEARLGAILPDPCVVIGLFMDHGDHSTDDIPQAIAAAHPDAAYSGAIGAHPGIADIILSLAGRSTEQ